VVLVGALTWCIALSAAPLSAAAAGNWSGAARTIYGFFHLICHQIPERSFSLFGWPLAVCSRCFSIYIAFLLGTILYPFLRPIDYPFLPPRGLLLAVALPLAVDGLSLGFLFYDVNIVSRMVTGSLFGIVLSFYIIPAVQQGVRELLAQPQALSIHQQKGLSDA
jgi:uncharacterized membrane protein